MAQLYPVSTTPLKPFYPIGTTPATCLTSHLPPGVPARCLLLGHGDARNILFTIYSELGGVPRDYDFTFCELEPAVVARNVLLLTLMMDNIDDESSPNYWSLFYDLYIEQPTLDLLEAHCAKLISYCQSVDAWHASPYGKIIRVVNLETISLMKSYYAKYTSPDNHFMTECRFSPEALANQLFEGPSYVYTTTLNRSFGACCFETSSRTSSASFTNYFWSHGTVNKSTINNWKFVNPTFVYSSTGGNHVALSPHTHPLAGFHLAKSMLPLTPESEFYCEETKTDDEKLENVYVAAYKEFVGWITAFQKACRQAQQEGELKIRMFVGEAITFCSALRDPEAPRGYSRPFSATPSQLDGDIPPRTFNVIDASTLVENVGFLNLAISTIPLLEKSPMSTWYVETFRPELGGHTELDLLPELLCHRNVPSVCALVGIIPVPYLTGISLISKDIGYHFGKDRTIPVHHRLPWKLVNTINPANANSIPSYEPEVLAKLLHDIHQKMFETETERYFVNLKKNCPDENIHLTPSPKYSRESFAAFVAFLKPRVKTDWHACIKSLRCQMQDDKTLMNGPMCLLDTWTQFYRHGVFVAEEFDTDIEEMKGTVREHHSTRAGILGAENPGKITSLIVTVPRTGKSDARLELLRNLAVDQRIGGNIFFQIHIIVSDDRKPYHHIFTSVHSVFGALSVSEDGRSVSLEEDPLGWHGQKDLHLLAYVPTSIFLSVGLENVKVSVRLMYDPSNLAKYDIAVGVVSKVFTTSAQSSSVHLLERFPRLEAPLRVPRQVPIIKEEFAFINENMEIGHPVFHADESFSTKIILKADFDRLYKSGAQVTVACTPLFTEMARVAISFASLELDCHFPFPILPNSTRLRLARKSGWIEVTSKLVPPHISGLMNRMPFPMMYDADATLVSWQPYISFGQLPCLKIPQEIRWLGTHCKSTIRKKDYPIFDKPGSETDLLKVKRLLGELLINIANGKFPIHVFQYQVVNDVNSPPTAIPSPYFCIFFTGLYLDESLGTVVAEGYVMDFCDLVKFPESERQVKRVAAGTIIAKEDFAWWTNAIRGMAERCRDWAHSPECELLSEEMTWKHLPVLCSCGKGKVGGNFKSSPWKKMEKLVTRIALSPMFAVPYLELSRVNGPSHSESTGSNPKPCQQQNGNAPSSGTPNFPNFTNTSESQLPRKPTVQLTRADLSDDSLKEVAEVLDLPISQITPDWPELLANWRADMAADPQYDLFHRGDELSLAETARVFFSVLGAKKAADEEENLDDECDYSKRYVDYQEKLIAWGRAQFFEEIVNRASKSEQASNPAGGHSIRCNVCHKGGKKTCGRCQRVKYCSRECQLKDWKNHKTHCKPV